MAVWHCVFEKSTILTPSTILVTNTNRARDDTDTRTAPRDATENTIPSYEIDPASMHAMRYDGFLMDSTSHRTLEAHPAARGEG